MDALSPASLAGRRSVPVPPGGGSPLVSRYMLRLLVRPLIATLIIVLPALLLERLLRLFDLLAGTGAMSPIVRLLLYLAPHYVGLALPAAFFISIFSVVAAISEHHELDAMQSIGVSIRRLSRPFMAVGVLLALFGVALYGYLEPLGRYQYRAAYNAATHAGWNAAVSPGEFIRIGRQLSVTADRVDEGTGELGGVFIEQRRPDGTTVTTTARRGWLTPLSDTDQLALDLEGGTQITITPDGTVHTLDFASSSIARHFSIIIPAFRPRGDDEREMTLDELWRHKPVKPDALNADPDAPPPVPERKLISELHGRLVRSCSLLLLPLLAIPMGLGAKRTRRWHGAALSALILMFYHHAVQLAESLGDIGVMDPRPMLWGVFVLFAIFCVTSFRRAERHPNEGPFDGFFAWMESAGDALTARLPGRHRVKP